MISWCTNVAAFPSAQVSLFLSKTNIVEDGLHSDQQRSPLYAERKGQEPCLEFSCRREVTPVWRPPWSRNPSRQQGSGDAGADRDGRAGGGGAGRKASRGRTARLSSQPPPLSPSAVTLNNTLSLITLTITLRNKLLLQRSRRDETMGSADRLVPLVSLRPSQLFGDKQECGSIWGSIVVTLSFHFFFSLVLCEPLKPGKEVNWCGAVVTAMDAVILRRAFEKQPMMEEPHFCLSTYMSVGLFVSLQVHLSI